MAKFDEEAWKKRIAREIAEEEARAGQDYRDRKMDQAFEREFFDALKDATGGMTPEEFRKAISKDIPDVTQGEVDEAMKIIAEASRLGKKGKWKKAKAKLNNSTVKKVGKAAKKGKGCAVITLFMLAVGGSTLAGLVYGAVEALAR